jgi:hypothetical protein
LDKCLSSTHVSDDAGDFAGVVGRELGHQSAIGAFVICSQQSHQVVFDEGVGANLFDIIA